MSKLIWHPLVHRQNDVDVYADVPSDNLKNKGRFMIRQTSRAWVTLTLNGEYVTWAPQEQLASIATGVEQLKIKAEAML